MFLSQSLLIELSLDEARSGLERLIRSGWLADTSSEAWADGLRDLASANGAGDRPAVPAPIEVYLLEPVVRDSGILLPMRWETVEPASRPFPVLDANLTLTPVTAETTRLGLTGSYRPHSGVFAPPADRAAVHKVAVSTVHGLLTRMATAIGTARPVGNGARLRTSPGDPGPARARSRASRRGGRNVTGDGPGGDRISASPCARRAIG